MFSALALFGQTTDYTYTYDTSTNTAAAGAAMGFLLVVWLIVLALSVLMLVCMAKVFVKAGRKWWEAIIPIYNTVVLLEIVGRPTWWLILFFIPFVNLVAAILVYIDLAKSFGKDAGVAILLLLFPYIMFPVMAFSNSYQYVGPAGGQSSGTVPTPQSPAATPPAAPVQ